MPADRLFIAKLLTLAVAVAMLLFNAARNRRHRNPRAVNRMKTFSLLAMAAGVLLVIQAHNPYSVMYVVGITLVGALIACALFFEYKVWCSR